MMGPTSLVLYIVFFDNRRESSKGQVRKGIWWMPRHQEAKKDVAGYEKPRGAASERRSVESEWGNPLLSKVRVFYAE
jgi:hypothetical protein